MAEPESDDERIIEKDRVETARVAEAERIAYISDARATAIAGLQAVANTQNRNIELLTQGVEALSKAIEHRPTRRETFNLVGVMQLLTLIVFVVGMTVMVQVVLNGQRQIADCVNETGTCAKRQAAKTQEVVTALNFTAIYTAECTRENAPNIEECVFDRLTVKLAEERAKAADSLKD